MSTGQFARHMALLAMQGYFDAASSGGGGLSSQDRSELHEMARLVRADGTLLNQMVRSLNTLSRAAEESNLVDPKFKKVSERINLEELSILISRFVEHEKNVRKIVVAAEAALPKRGYKKRKVSDA